MLKRRLPRCADNIDDTTPIEKLRHASHTVVRPLGASFPPRFEVASKKERQPVQPVANEKILLNSVLGVSTAWPVQYPPLMPRLVPLQA